MAIINRPRFKISQDPGSNKVQGLRVGDVVLRQYFDNTTQFYSLMLVDEIGGTQATGSYFVAQLIDGDEPGATGVELLDFVRVTNIIDEERMGAVYISGTGSDAPRIDALADGGKEASICWPTFLGAGGYDFRNANASGSAVMVDEPQINSKRAIKITRSSSPMVNAWDLGLFIKMPQDAKKLVVGKEYVVSYRYRGSKSISVSALLADSNGTNRNAQWVDNFTTAWQYRSIQVSCEYSTSDQHFFNNLAAILSSGDWVEYADFTVVPVDSMKIIRSSVKSCVGNMNGIVDPVFGQLKDYGGYFQRLYATKDVNIAGTLTAGDENGFGTTFYAGKIAKNLITNSDIRPENNAHSMTVGVESIGLPNGTIGSARKITSTGAVSQYYFGSKSGLIGEADITFSVFVKSLDSTEIAIGVNDLSTGVGEIKKNFKISAGWSRLSVSQNTSRIPSGSISFFVEPVDQSSNGQSWYLWGFQVEYSKTVTPYQPTDGTLSSSTDYGMWANRGGFGGTIQNPILKLQPDGTIVGGNNKLILRPDGSAEFNGTVVISGSGGQPLDVEQAINQAKSEAISTSSTDATTKANQAKLDAEAAAALDAAQKAAQAKNDAISSAATDATNKAGTAKSEAISAASQDATTKANGAVTTALANTVTEIGKIDIGGRNYIVLGSINSFPNYNSKPTFSGSTISTTRVGLSGQIITIRIDGWIPKGVVYTLSGSIKKNGSPITNNMWIQKRASTYNNDPISFSLDDNSGNFVIVEKYNGSDVWVLHCAIDWVYGDIVTIDGFKMESGNKRTDWTPSPEDIDSNINTQFNASKQFATDSITDLKNNYLGDLALMDTLDGGKITDGTIAFAKLGSTIISGGYIKTELLDANAIRTNIINVNYIEGLSLNFVRGMIGGWVIGDNTISSGGVAISSALRSMFVTKPSGGHSTVGQTYVGGVWTGKYGFASTNASGQVLFRADEAANVIGGWNFDTSKLYSGAIELGSSGYIRNTSDKWRLNNDGSGQLAAGNIGWDAAGNVTFGANVQLNWKNYTDSAVAGVVVGGRNYYKKNTPYSSLGTAAIFSRNQSINGFQLTGAADANSSHIRLLQLLTSNGDWTVSFEFSGTQKVPVAFTMEIADRAPKRFNNPSTTDEWLRVEYTVNVTNYTPDVYHFIDFEHITYNYINFRNFKVEKGNKATDWSAAPEDDDYLKTHIDANGIYTGTLTTQQLNAAAATVLGNVTAGSFDIGSGKFLVDAGGNLTAVGANVSGTITAGAGKIGGWNIYSNVIGSPDGRVNINSDKGSVYIDKPNGGYVMLGQTFVGGNWTGNYGFSSSDGLNRTLVRMDSAENRIAGWLFDHEKLSSGTIEISSTGYIRNTADKWRLNNDGSVSFASGKFSADTNGNAQIAGWRIAADLLASDGDKSVLRKNGSGKLANGNIDWDVDGNVTLGSKVKLAWGTDSKNLVDWSEWTVGSGSTTNFTIDGANEENSRVIAQNPFSIDSVMWKCTANVPKNPDGSPITGADGGFNSAYFDIDRKYPYRFCVWVKKQDSDGGTYFGCGAVSNLTGSDIDSVNVNPYFSTAKILDEDGWVLLVGIIHPEGYLGTSVGISGIYDVNGGKMSSGNEYRWTHTAVNSRMRAYLCYSTFTGEIQYMYNPLVHKMDGTEPSLSQIINNRIVTTHIDANGIYTGTLTANQINVVGIDASKITVGNLTVGGTNAGGIGSVRVLDASNNELVRLGVDGIVATKGVIGGMTIAGNKMTGGSIELTSGAKILDMEIKYDAALQRTVLDAGRSLKISTGAIIGGMKVDDIALTNSGFNNDAYIVLRNDNKGTFVGIGGDVMPAGVGTRATGRFECEGSQYGLSNTALVLRASGATGFDTRNIALDMQGEIITRPSNGEARTGKNLDFMISGVWVDSNKYDIILQVTNGLITSYRLQ